MAIDQTAIQRLKNEISDGELTLRTGKFNKRKLSKTEIDALSIYVDKKKKKLKDMTKYKVGQKIQWYSPKGIVFDEIKKVDGIYVVLKSGGTIPYQSIVEKTASKKTRKSTATRTATKKAKSKPAISTGVLKYSKALGNGKYEYKYVKKRK